MSSKGVFWGKEDLEQHDFISDLGQTGVGWQLEQSKYVNVAGMLYCYDTSQRTVMISYV